MAIVVDGAGPNSPGPEGLQSGGDDALLELAMAQVSVERIAEQHLVVILAIHGEGSLLLGDESRIVLVGGRTGGRVKARVLRLLRRFQRALARVESHPHVRVHIDDEQVEPPIAVVVEHLRADRAVWSGTECLHRDIRESPISAIAVQLAATEHARHEYIEVAVTVVVEDRDITRPAAPAQ